MGARDRGDLSIERGIGILLIGCALCGFIGMAIATMGSVQSSAQRAVTDSPAPRSTADSTSDLGQAR